MVYKNKFTDGHKHNTANKSPKGYPQCSLCGKLVVTGQQLKEMRKNAPKKENTKQKPKATKQKAKQTTSKQTTSKIVVNIPETTLQPTLPNQLMGEAFRIVNKFSNDAYATKNHLNNYLKNRRNKNAN